FVFTDAKLERQAGRFVWLSMNTEETSAGPFLEKFPVEGWPTLFIIDPRTERVALKWPGVVTVPQLERLLDDGERAVKGAGKGLKEAPGRAELIAPLEKAAAELLAKRDIAIAADDYSSLFGTMVEVREDRGDAEGARATAETWARYLEEQAAKTTTPEARSV